MFPIVSFSWTILDVNTFTKKLDKSAFKYNGTGIPKPIKMYWGADNMKYNEVREIECFFESRKYKMKITCDQKLRTRLYWERDFSEVLTTEFSELKRSHIHDEEVNLFPEMRFKKIKEKLFYVEFVTENRDFVSCDDSIFESSRAEGNVFLYYSRKYERCPQNRSDAIKIHGYKCSACDFLFEDKYGKLGKGFIEMHHTKPLYENEKEVIINPRTDLVPICSSCHQMIHRKRDRLISINSLRNIIETQNDIMTNK